MKTTNNYATNETIAAIATAPGRGSVGIIRISGPLTATIAQSILGFTPAPRQAHYTDFYNSEGLSIDKGLALYFKGPQSFTGEDVLELQGHGGPVVLDMLLTTVLKQGARLAKPGEFSERAFLNDKMDLAQAEAIADLINASSEQAAKHAMASLQGAFSQKIDALLEQLIQLRMYVESAIDFPEEEIDFLSDQHIQQTLQQVIEAAQSVLSQAKQGSLIRDGMKVVIAGRPNAGKSSLLNALSCKEVAIVTDIAGTTRDVLREYIHIDGMPLHIVDTAGLRDSSDRVESMGIDRAWEEIHAADRILLLLDSTDPTQRDAQSHWPEFFNHPELAQKMTLLYNKVDAHPLDKTSSDSVIAISAKTGQGLDTLKHHLKNIMGYTATTEGGFSARRRHLTAIQTALQCLKDGYTQLAEHQAGELLAEDLRAAQNALGEVTGAFTPDDLLGEIFSSFCIGK